jgi:hypothetical protein
MTVVRQIEILEDRVQFPASPLYGSVGHSWQARSFRKRVDLIVWQVRPLSLPLVIENKFLFRLLTNCMSTKTCNACDQNKSLSEFNERKSSPDGHCHTCRECSKVRNRQWYVANTKKAVEKAIRNRRAYLVDARRSLDAAKSDGCVACPETAVVCMDFHHLEDKKYELSDLWHKCPGWKTLQGELAKCIVLCANCHRKVHKGLLTITPEMSKRRVVLPNR